MILFYIILGLFGLALNTVIGYAVVVCIDAHDSRLMNIISRVFPHFTWLIVLNLWPLMLGYYAWCRFFGGSVK